MASDPSPSPSPSPTPTPTPSPASALKGNPALLIKEVHARRPIWDLKSPAHHNRDIVHKLWTEIGNKLGKPLDAVKNKWKHLRDNFRTELKKTVRGSGNPPRPYRSQWTFFDDLLFLEEQMMKKIDRTYGPFPFKTASNVEGRDDDDEIDDDNDNDNDNDNGNYPARSHSVFDDEPIRDREPMPWWSRNDPVDAGNNFIETNDEIDVHDQRNGRRHAKVCRRPVSDVIADDDYHFMMSLLPYIKSLPVARKMFLRLRLQELVCNFIYRLDSNGDGDLTGSDRKDVTVTGRDDRTKCERADRHLFIGKT